MKLPMNLQSSALLSLLLCSACSTVSGVEPGSERPPHHTDTGFQNLYIEDRKKGFFSFLKMKFFGDQEWADAELYAAQIPWQPLELQEVLKPPEQPQISWLGHSTFLIQYRGINVLTDPVFCDRTSPFSFMGPKRYTRHVVEYAKLPAIDYVVISHNHYDHLDAEATAQLATQAEPPQYFVPLGLKAWLLEQDERLQAERITEMDWGDRADAAALQVSAHPSQHWSARSLFDRFETLWASWRIDWGDFSVWFAGDSGYNERLFAELAEQMPPVDLALIPIGAYAPRDFMQAYHMNPEEAVLLHQQLQPRWSIAMHWGTYPLTAEVPTEPPKRLQSAAAEAGLGSDEFSVMSLGQTRVLDLRRD